MPDFSAHRRQNPHKPGSLMYDLRETKQDIKAAKRGEETEASLAEMLATKRRLRREIRNEVMQEEAAKANDRSPTPKVHARPKGARVWA